MTDFDELPEFSKELRKLSRKYRSLPNDIKLFKKVLKATLPNHPPGTVRISGLAEEVQIPIYKVKNFRCTSLKGKGSRSGIRVIYAFIEDACSVVFIEIYHKNRKENEDKARIIRNFQEFDEVK